MDFIAKPSCFVLERRICQKKKKKKKKLKHLFEEKEEFDNKTSRMYVPWNGLHFPIFLM